MAVKSCRNEARRPASSILFALAYHLIFHRFKAECVLVVHRLHADDEVLVVKFDESKLALDITAENGAFFDFILNSSHLKAYWST